MRHGFIFTEGKSYWTLIAWLENLSLDALLRDDEYLLTQGKFSERLETLDKRIEEISKTEVYAEKVSKLSCFLGVKTHTAMSVITGDFSRFAKAEQYAAYLGLVPSEHSSGEKEHRDNEGGKLSFEEIVGRVGTKLWAWQSRLQIKGVKSISVRKLERSYPLCANERMRRKFYKMIFSGKAQNVAKTAVARELACFIWGMMTQNIK